jgi:excinuclease UvrABC nuclease subunit
VLTHSLEFTPDRDEEPFAAVPAASAVFLLRGADASSEPYVSKTSNLRRRFQRLLGVPNERTKRLNLRQQVRHIEYSQTGSDFESGFLLYKTLRAIFPAKYSERMRFRFPPLVKLHLENAYPRASVTTRLGRLNGASVYYGPFPSRAFAEQFASDSLDFFKMRRCVDDLHPDPQFPGCIYSEMKMCLAPCFKGCTDEAYAQEVGRVRNYFDSAGESLLREISSARDSASSSLDFENAAALHSRIEKLKTIQGRVPEIFHRIDHLHGLIVQPSANPGCVAFFRVRSAFISNPIDFPIQPTEHAKSPSTQVRSMESRIQAALQDSPPAQPKNAIETSEHLAILSRWFFRSRRLGEIFLEDSKGELPMRRVVRGVSRVFRGEKPEQEAASALDARPVPPSPT